MRINNQWSTALSYGMWWGIASAALTTASLRLRADPEMHPLTALIAYGWPMAMMVGGGLVSLLLMGWALAELFYPTKKTTWDTSSLDAEESDNG